MLVASVGAFAAGGVRGTQNGQGGRTESVYDNSQELWTATEVVVFCCLGLMADAFELAH